MIIKRKLTIVTSERELMVMTPMETSICTGMPLRQREREEEGNILFNVQEHIWPQLEAQQSFLNRFRFGYVGIRRKARKKFMT